MIPQTDFILVRGPRTDNNDNPIKIGVSIQRNNGKFDFSDYSFLRMRPDAKDPMEEWVPTKELHLYKKSIRSRIMRTLIDPNSSCGFCGGYDLGTRCESCGAGSDNYDALGGEQGWIMKSKLNELRLDAGIARIENQQWLCVLDKETGMMIDPLIGLEKFAELIVAECRDIVEQDMKLAHIQMIPLTLEKYANGRLKEKIKEHFGVEE